MRPFMTVIVLMLATSAQAEVLDKAAGGFTIRLTSEVEADASRTYQVFTEQVGRWWHPDHTFSADASRLSMDARPGGCFCERLDGGGLQHLMVTYADQGKHLRLSGGLGPLHELGVAGNMKIEFTGDKSTLITLTYAVGGYLPAGLDSWADAVEFVLNQQLERLKRFVETGSPVPAS